SRISLRRHALLVDYHVHDGCNARTWMSLQVSSAMLLDRTVTRFYTPAPGMPANLKVGSGNEHAALNAGVIVFEPMQNAELFPEHNQLTFYTWGDTNCCLPVGSTEATLYGTLNTLQPGDVLIFQEMKGPDTGFPADADIRHRCAVRLRQVTTVNAQGQMLVDPLFEDKTGLRITNPAAQKPTPVTEIQWAAEDALKFPLCLLSSFVDSSGGNQNVDNVSVAFGNVVLADHGLTISNADFGKVPAPTTFLAPDPNSDHCDQTDSVPVPVRFRPTVPDAPVTQAVPLTLAGSPVTTGMVMLNATGFVSLNDADGELALMVRADQPLQWPQYFGVVVEANAVHPANFDLSVVYDPPGGLKGLSAPAVLEKFEDLSFSTGGPDFVATQINLLSKLISVPSTYVPPAAAPAGFASTP